MYGRKNHHRHYGKKPPRSSYKNQSSKEYQHHNQLQETDVGITEFLSKLEGFSGIIKARFSDFQVSEIDLNGEIAKLTLPVIPEEFKTPKNVVRVNLEDPHSPLEQIPQEIWESIKKLLDNDDNNSVKLNVKQLTKEDRAKIHECLKSAFGKKICAQTVTENEEKWMIFKKHDGKDDNRLKWPSNTGEYVHFIVYKESLDTLEACLKIASNLRMSPSNFTYAGVKDKRAKTTQWFSVRKVHPAKLIAGTRRLPKIKIGNITLKEAPLKLGQLNGNKFRIALRNVTGSDELIEKSLMYLKENGFINYYGLQRFGNDKEVPTFSIGLKLLLGNWKEACQIILKPTESDDTNLDITKAKKIYSETGIASEALKQFSGNQNNCIEYLLLSGLDKENSNDYVNALSHIPRNTRLLYIHSFQSLVWNLVASKRIEKYGLTVIEGDLVSTNEEIENVEEILAEEDNSSTEKQSKVKAITSEECCNYSVYDIVLPLPGYDIIYPENMKDIYKEILEKYGLTLEMTKQKVQTYSLSGTYRKLLGRVQDLSWKIMHYNDPNYNLIRSDFEELKGEPEPKDLKDAKYKALILEFSLKSSSYATMVLREILKTDTSSSAQAKLNNYHSNNTKIISTSFPSTEAQEDFSDKVGLLSDTKKYEAFKNIVFNVTSNEDDVKKRKLDQENEDNNDGQKEKYIKLDE